MQANDRAIVRLTMGAHALVHTYELSIPILMTIWLSEFDVSKANLGLVVSAGYALFGLGALPGGVLSDRFGSRRLIALCAAGMGGAFLALSLAGGLFTITVALVLWGAAASVYHPAGLALISKGVFERGSAFAYHGMAGNAGIALGPLMTTLLLLLFDWRTVAALLALPAGLAALYAWRAEMDETAAARHAAEATPTSSSEAKKLSLSAFLTDSRTLLLSGFLIVFFIVMLSGLYYRGVLTFLPDLLGSLLDLDALTLGSEELRPERYVYVGLLMIGVLGQYVGGKLTDRMPTERGITITFAILAGIALLFLPVAQMGLWPLLMMSALLGFFLFVVQPLYQATVADYTPAAARGLSYGYMYLGVFGIGALGAALAGAVLDFFDQQALFLVLAGLALLAALLGFVLLRRTLKPAAAEEQG